MNFISQKSHTQELILIIVQLLLRSDFYFLKVMSIVFLKISNNDIMSEPTCSTDIDFVYFEYLVINIEIKPCHSFNNLALLYAYIVREMCHHNTIHRFPTYQKEIIKLQHHISKYIVDDTFDHLKYNSYVSFKLQHCIFVISVLTTSIYIPAVLMLI